MVVKLHGRQRMLTRELFAVANLANTLNKDSANLRLATFS